jgi:hypothetical protein
LVGQGRRANSEASSKCILLNARSIKNKFDDFNCEIICGESLPAVVGMTETWLDGSIPNELFNCCDKYDLFRCDRDDKFGGVALFLRKDLKAKPFHSETFNGIELVAAHAKFKDSEVIFAFL